MLYEVATRTWRTLATTSAADPIWSSDSKSIYIHAYMASGQPILKLDISDGHFTEVASLKSFPVGEADRYYFAGITRSNVPLVRVETFSGNLYSVNLDSK